MKVAFLHMEDENNNPELQRRLARIMIHSVRRNIPDAWVVQMTDLQCPIIEGVDESRRLDPNSPFLMPYRLRHLARLKGEFLILDTDTVVLKDVSAVFKMAFDVCLTKRDKQILSANIGYTKDDPVMPYNTGVMFSRSQEFWKDALRVCEGLEERHRRWYGDQIAIASVVEGRKYNVAVLPCEKWNHSPATENETPDGRRILHFKGKRKQWMLNYEGVMC